MKKIVVNGEEWGGLTDDEIAALNSTAVQSPEPKPELTFIEALLALLRREW